MVEERQSLSKGVPHPGSEKMSLWASPHEDVLGGLFIIPRCELEPLSIRRERSPFSASPIDVLVISQALLI